MTRQRRRLIGNLAVALAATAATLLVCEGLARLFLSPPSYHREPLVLDPLLGFRGIPGHRQEIADEQGRYVFALNAQGFRGREIPEPPRAASGGALRIAFFGDSFLVGGGVRDEQIATSLVEAELRSRGREAEVFNLSSADWGTGQELLALRSLGRPLAPDLVVLFVYPANDWINNSMALAGRTTASAGDPIRPYLVWEGDALRVRYMTPLRAFARRHSRLFAVLERRILGKAAMRAGRREDPEARRLRGGALPDDLEVLRPRLDPGDRWEQAWETSLGLLRAFRDECDAMGARLLVVVVPSVHQVVRSPRWLRLDAQSRAQQRQPLSATLDWDLPERRLAEFFAAEGIEARLLLRPLREAAQTGERVYGHDEHLAPRGHEIAAGRVLDWILASQPSPSLATAEFGQGPVAILPDAEAAPGWLDFGSDRQLAFLGDGWISWQPSAPDRAGGWLIGPRALAVVPLREGAFEIRGWTPPSARLPILVRVQVIGGPEDRFRVDRPGRFDGRVFGGSPGARNWITSSGYVAVLLAATPPGSQAGDVGVLWIEGLGYRDAAAPPAPGAPPEPSASDTLQPEDR